MYVCVFINEIVSIPGKLQDTYVLYDALFSSWPGPGDL